MSHPTVPLLIDGAWSQPEVAQSGNVYNPSAGEVIAQIPDVRGQGSRSGCTGSPESLHRMVEDTGSQESGRHVPLS